MKYRVKEIREQKKMTREELEQKSGISRQTISAIENGHVKNVMAGTLLALANAMDTTIDNFLFNQTV